MTGLIFSTIIYSLVFLTLFTFGEFLYHVTKIKGEWTRKFVHAFGGFISLTFPLFLENHWQVLFLTFSFVGILGISLIFNILPSINNVKRTTHGSIIFPVVIYLCYLVYHLTEDLIYFYVPIIILAISDPAANIIGKHFPKIPYKILGYTKTVSGSFAFMSTALICSTLVINNLNPYTYYRNCILAISISFIAMLTESISHKGYDNLTIPMSSIIVIAIFNNYIFV